MKPMLAERFDEKKAGVVYPVFIQPKLDGYRGLYKAGGFQSRGGSPLNAETSGIRAELARADLLVGATLDGELYMHGHSFNAVSKAIRNGAHELEYWVYDLVSPKPYAARKVELQALFARNVGVFKRVKLVETHVARSEADVWAWHDRFKARGFEGAVVRIASAPYADRRTTDLLKVKVFMDDEFEVVGYASTSEGCVKWECIAPSGRHFFVVPSGSKSDARAALRTASAQVGKMYKVKFQEMLDGVPRFPVGLGFRDARDMDKKKTPKRPTTAKSPKSPGPTRRGRSAARKTAKPASARRALTPKPRAATPKRGHSKTPAARNGNAKPPAAAAAAAAAPAAAAAAAAASPRRGRTPTAAPVKPVLTARPAAARASPATCVRKTTSSYLRRKSPPFSAVDCPDRVLMGNDGTMWKSTRVGAQRSYTWKRS